MERNHSVLLQKAIDLESRVLFIENFLHIGRGQDSNVRRNYRPVKIIFENAVQGSADSLELSKYLSDPFFDVYFVRIYDHGLQDAHEETTVTLQSGIYKHLFIRRLYSVHILSRCCLLTPSPSEYKNEMLLNTDLKKTSNILRLIVKPLDGPHMYGFIVSLNGILQMYFLR